MRPCHALLIPDLEVAVWPADHFQARRFPGFMITTVMKDFPHFCRLMALVGHATLNVALFLSTPCSINTRNYFRAHAAWSSLRSINSHGYARTGSTPACVIVPRGLRMHDRVFIPPLSPDRGIGYHINDPMLKKRSTFPRNYREYRKSTKRWRREYHEPLGLRMRKGAFVEQVGGIGSYR